MEARLKLYTDIVMAMRSEVPEIKTFDLWNRQVEFLQEDTAFECPALFIEFGAIQWAQKYKETCRGLEGLGEVRLHLVTDWHAHEDGVTAMQLSEKMFQALLEMPGVADYQLGFPSHTLTNHDHEEVMESIEVIGARYWRDIPY